MNEIDLSKYEKIINKNRDKDKNKNKNEGKDEDKFFKKYFSSFFMKLLVVSVLLVSLAIVYKSDSFLRDKISGYFFEEDISFTKIKKIYDKYLGGILPVEKNDNVTEVFDEKLQFDSSSIYYDGVKLSVDDSYLVPSLCEGMVVFVGDKENYGKTVIVESLDGVEYWYGNVSSTSLKLYDYIEKGSLVGEVQKEFYMVFSTEGKYLNYEEFIY